MPDRTGSLPDQTTPTQLDWRQSSVGDPAPCVVCRRPALMRHPETGQPHHKVCGEPAVHAAAVPEPTATEDRVFYSEDGWTLPHEPGVQPCVINRVPEDEGRQACAATAVWKVVEFHDHTTFLTLGIWCPDHIPAKGRRFTPDGSAVAPCHVCGQPASLSGPEGKPEHWSCRRKAGVR